MGTHHTGVTGRKKGNLQKKSALTMVSAKGLHFKM